MSRFLAALRGSLLLFDFWLGKLHLLQGLSPLLRDPDALEQALSERPAELRIPAKQAVAKHYNTAIDRLADQIRALHGPNRQQFSTTVVWQFAIRFALILAALSGVRPSLVLFASASQFIIAPYSFFINLAMTVALAPNLYAAHYLAFSLASLALTFISSLLPSAFSSALSSLTIDIDWSFFACFLILDLLATTVCHLVYSEKRGLARLLRHGIYGTLNAKSYYWVMLPVLVHAHVTVRLLPLVLAALLTPYAARLLSGGAGLHWAGLFYHQHRLAHLPEVYIDAHKFHHYMDSSTAFDAHIYGSGMPEEWSTLVIEVAASVWLGVPPLSINPYILYISWTNKVGHTKQPEADSPGGTNNHVDHHEFHVKNYGIYNPLLDIFFGTHAPKALAFRDYRVAVRDDELVLSKVI